MFATSDNCYVILMGGDYRAAECVSAGTCSLCVHVRMCTCVCRQLFFSLQIWDSNIWDSNIFSHGSEKVEEILTRKVEVGFLIEELLPFSV